MKKFLLLILTSFIALSLSSCKEKTKDESKKDPETFETENNGSDENTKDDFIKDPETFETENNGSDEKIDETVNYLSGTDAAKMLLAQNRLNPQKLNDSVNIFNGEQVYKSLAEKVRRTKKMRDSNTNTDVTITDTTVEWKNSDKNYSNNISYFENITGNVANNAERGAEMIKNVKSYVRVINCWVKVGNQKYLLLVDENSETIFVASDNWLDICRRYTNEAGQDVYELYYSSEVGQTRMKYIENTLVEYFYDHSESEFEHHFVADNTKGYWDVYGHLGSDHNSTVIKDKIVYDYICSYGSEKPAILDIVSNDRLNDVISLNGYSFELSAHAFDGIDKFVVNIDSQDDIVPYEENMTSGKVFDHGGFYYPIDSRAVNIVLDNGTVLKPEDGTDKVKYKNAFLSADHALNVYYQQISLGVEGETLEEQFTNLKEFLSINGITCKYDLDEIFNNALLAYEEIASQSKYRLWNGVVVNSQENVLKALELEKAKFDNFKKMFEETEELEVIDIENQDEINNKIDFADIDLYVQDSVKFENNVVTVENLKLTINKSPLLDTRETYSLKFGLIDTNNIFNEVLLDIKLDNIKYNGEEKFELVYNGEFDLVNGGIGEYVLAVYLATSEGIRISELEYVKVDEFNEYFVKDINHVITLSKTEEGYLFMEVEKNMDIYITNKFYDILSYEDLMIEMGSVANLYGMVKEDAYIEVLNENQEYIKLENDIVSGEYRICYMYYTEKGYKDAYLYMTVTIDVVRFEHTTKSITLTELQALFIDKLGEYDDIQVYSEETKDYINVNEEFTIVSGKYRVAYKVVEEDVEHLAHSYLDLTVETDELAPNNNN